MTLTKEWLQQKIADMEAARDEIPFGLDEDDRNTLAAMKLALASLEAEPVAWRSLYYENHGLLTGSKNVLASWQKQGWKCEPLYSAPPAPVSDNEPVQMFGIGSAFKPQIVSVDEVDCDNCAHYQPNICHGEGCPAAMLQGAEPADQ